MFYYQNTYAQTGNWDVSTTPSVTTVTPKDVSIGTGVPDGKTEIFIGCSPRNGLVITKDEDCPIPYTDVPLFLNAEAVPFGTGDGTTAGEPTFSLPFNFKVGSTLSMTVVTSGASSGFTSTIPNNPLIWARTKDVNSNGMYSSTRFIVMPDGKAGFNVYNPRATLDVRNMNPSKNIPAAIFGVNEGGAIPPLLPNNNQFRTRHVQIVPKCNTNGFNQITQDLDLGIFFTDGKGLDGANLSGGMVIAPWAASGNPAIGGIRINANGNVDVHGNLKATKVTINTVWWSDFVFATDYKKMTLPQLEVFIKANKHLPNIPSEKEVLSNGINVADMQALQLQKIEELTLYAIEQQKQIEEQKLQLAEQQKLLAELAKKVELVLPNK